MVAIPGRTYHVRSELKAIGAWWNQRLKVWEIDPSKLDQAIAIVKANQPAETKYEYHQCPTCGQAVRTEVK